jgi:hypothetical protein
MGSGEIVEILAKETKTVSSFQGKYHECERSRERRHRKSMTHPSVHIQIAPTSVPSTPSWLGEVAVVAHVFSQLGLQKAIEERVRFARARMGTTK